MEKGTPSGHFPPSPKMLGWLVVVIDKMACFTVKSNGEIIRPRLVINSSPHNTADQREVEKLLGCGEVLEDGRYVLEDLNDLFNKAIPILDCVVFWTKKKNEYLIWRKMTFLSHECLGQAPADPLILDGIDDLAIELQARRHGDVLGPGSRPIGFPGTYKA